MFIPIKAVSVLIAFAAVGFASPTPELAPRAGITVSISSTSNFCMVVPNTPHTNIGVSEHPGGMTSYCSPGKIPSNFWTRPTFKRGTGVHGKAYVQLTGCINPKVLDRLNANDDGGQYDSSGGAGGRGNPQGSVCAGYAHYVELIEPSSRQACIRCCQDAADCPTNRDTAGCQSVIPAKYGC